VVLHSGEKILKHNHSAGIGFMMLISLLLLATPFSLLVLKYDQFDNLNFGITVSMSGFGLIALWITLRKFQTCPKCKTMKFTESLFTKFYVDKE